MAYCIEHKLGPLTQLCQLYGVRKLVLFGSALREDFDPQRSDLDFLVDFNVKGARISDYSANPMLKAAVERKCEVIREALGQLSRHFPDIPVRIAGCGQVIAFRNRPRLQRSQRCLGLGCDRDRLAQTQARC